MALRRLTDTEVRASTVAQLGLDETELDLTSVETIAAALRRIASFLCPCAGATLICGVLEPLRGLVENMAHARRLVRETLEAMIAHGDFLELPEIEEHSASAAAVLLYAAPARFVARESGAAILLGLSIPLSYELADRVEYVKHSRRIRPVMGEDLGVELRQLGLTEVTYDSWLGTPGAESPGRHLSRLDRELDAAPPSGDVPGLSMLDWGRPVRYYRGRWTSPLSHSGRFVARRSQAYGADLWSYIEMRNGRTERLIDLPLVGSRWRGCDEAWRLQMAIDAARGHSQRFRVCSGPSGTLEIHFFSPIPMWARRRLDAVGAPASASGCLFAYQFGAAELDEEVRFARDVLWLEDVDGRQQSP